MLAIRPCVQSGLCCKQSVCAFGIWNPTTHQCDHLQIVQQTPKFTRYRCGIKAEIEALPPTAGAIWNPAFGGGCGASLFNANRNAILRHFRTEDAILTDIELAIINHVIRICGKTTTTPRIAALGILKRLGEPIDETINEVSLEELLSVVPDNVLDDWRQ